MKPLDELDHYEILEVSHDASREEIERAYRLLQGAYARDSLGVYSVFDERESALLRERAELAYGVLSDPEARRAYDARLRGDEEASAEADLDFEPEEDAAAEALEFEGFEELEVDDEDADWDGARLRRSRLLRGMELAEIAKVTKINSTYLRFLEEERFDSLPAQVYVRGFVAAYAHCLGLDAARVAARYMHRFQARRGARQPGRLLGRQ